MILLTLLIFIIFDRVFVLSSSKDDFLLIFLYPQKVLTVDPCHTRISSSLEGILPLPVKENQALVALPCSRCIHWGYSSPDGLLFHC